MELKKFYLVCGMLILALVTYAADNGSHPSSRSGHGKSVYWERKRSSSNDKGNPDKQEVLRLQALLQEKENENRRLKNELSQARFALEEIARMLNYLPAQRLSKEQLQAIDDLLADEPGILRIIKKYHDFIKTLEGKKIIILPEN